MKRLGRWEQDEGRFSDIVDAILDGDVVATGQSRMPKYLLHAFAHCQNTWRFGIAIRNRPPVSLAQAWNGSPQHPLPALDGEDALRVPNHALARRCAEYVATVLACAESPLEEWATSLATWDTMIEKSRELFGLRWVQCRLACIASGIRSAAEQCNDASEMLDASKPLCRRARYARLRAGQPAWWERLLQSAKSELDLSFVLLILITWGSKNCLASLAAPVTGLLEGLSTPTWRKLSAAVRQSIEVIRSETGEDLLDRDLELESAPPGPHERLIIAFGERASQESAAKLYTKYLSSYSGSDYPVLHFGQRQAIKLLFDPAGDKSSHLAMIERSYARGVMTEHAFPWWKQSEVAMRGISAAVAERIASQPDRFPMELVRIAEAVCKELVSAQVVPVGVVAQKEKWFPE